MESNFWDTVLGVSVVLAPRWPEGINKASGGDSLGTVNKGEQQARQVLYQVTTRRARVFSEWTRSPPPNGKGKVQVHRGIGFFWVLTLFSFRPDISFPFCIYCGLPIWPNLFHCFLPHNSNFLVFVILFFLLYNFLMYLHQPKGVERKHVWLLNGEGPDRPHGYGLCFALHLMTDLVLVFGKMLLTHVN